MTNQRPVEIFFSYAHEDEALMDAVRRQMVVFERQDAIRKWHDRQIPAGADWQKAIDERLRLSEIILLFVSPDFLASDYCYDAEMQEAMRLHASGAARVIPIILRPCAWDVAPFAKLQALPVDAKPLSQWADRDQACLDVARGVMQVARRLRGELDVPESAPAVRTDDRMLAVLTHRAFFEHSPVEHYFINLTNLSTARPVEVTHVWYEDESHQIPVLPAARPLPVRLDLDQVWETWIPTAALPEIHRADALTRFRARLSTGTVFTSVANPTVPLEGFVPGGPTL